jgi:hypothetical protein
LEDEVEKSATRRVRDGFFLVVAVKDPYGAAYMLFEDWRL